MQDLFTINSSSMAKFNFSLKKVRGILREHSLKNQVFDTSTETAIITCYVILIAAGLCINLMVCSVVLSNAKIRCSRNVLVVNLNISDILLCVFCMPFTLMILIRRSWVFGDFLCKFVPFVQASTVFGSAATVSVIAIDRCKVVLSFNPQRIRKADRNMSINAATIWICSLLLSLPMCIFRGTIPVGVHGVHMYFKCVEKWPSTYTKVVYTLLTLIAQFVIPGLVLLTTHLQIKLHLNSRSVGNESDNSANQAEVGPERLKRDLQRNTRATMVLLNISVVFTISWLPWNALNLLADFHPYFLDARSLYLAFAICHIVAMTSSVTNPILYGWLNSNIRREMVRLSSVVVKAGSSLVSSCSSASENVVMHEDNTVIKTSGNDSAGRRDTSESHF